MVKYIKFNLIKFVVVSLLLLVSKVYASEPLVDLAISYGASADEISHLKSTIRLVEGIERMPQLEYSRREPSEADKKRVLCDPIKTGEFVSALKEQIEAVNQIYSQQLVDTFKIKTNNDEMLCVSLLALKGYYVEAACRYNIESLNYRNANEVSNIFLSNILTSLEAGNGTLSAVQSLYEGKQCDIINP